jgi:hypothetical protein
VSDPVLGGRVLDVPALLDAASGASDYMRAWLAVMTRRGYTVAVPSTVRARAAGELSTAGELAELDWFCSGGTVIEFPVTAADAAELDQLAKDCFAGETAAAHAALVARRRGWPVITSEEREPGFAAAGISTELLP